MKLLKKITLLLIMFLIFSLSIAWGVFPIVIGALFGWYWLSLYSIHLASVLIIALCCSRAKEGNEEDLYVKINK